MQNAINTKTAFESIGEGFSMAGAWMTIHGKREWVSLTACAPGRGQRRDWQVSASYGSGDARREAVCTKPNSFRYEVADEALAALMGEVETPAVAQ